MGKVSKKPTSLDGVVEKLVADRVKIMTKELKKKTKKKRYIKPCNTCEFARKRTLQTFNGTSHADERLQNSQ